jgi:hypothetical protein
MFVPMWLRHMHMGAFGLLFGIMCAPPLLAGFLFILVWQKERGATG